MEGCLKADNKKVKIFNVYGPYNQCKYFLEVVQSEGFLKDVDIIVGGDLNLVTSIIEIWGDSSKPDPLDYFFNNMLTNVGLVHVFPIPLVPTWQNGQAEESRVVKRSDQVLVVDSLLQSFEKYRPWLELENLLDHQPIWLQLDHRKNWKTIPFKFNHNWIKDKEFTDLVKKNWITLSQNEGVSPIAHL